MMQQKGESEEIVATAEMVETMVMEGKGRRRRRKRGKTKHDSSDPRMMLSDSATRCTIHPNSLPMSAIMAISVDVAMILGSTLQRNDRIWTLWEAFVRSGRPMGHAMQDGSVAS